MLSAELPVHSLCAGGALAVLGFWWVFKCLFLYCSATSKHKQLLVTAICGDDHSGQWSANYQGDSSEKCHLSELLSLGGFCPLVFCTCSFRNTLLQVPFWQKGCPFAYCLNLGHEELSGLLLCQFSPSRCCFRNKAKLRKEKKSQSRGYLNIWIS